MKRNEELHFGIPSYASIAPVFTSEVLRQDIKKAPQLWLGAVNI